MSCRNFYTNVSSRIIFKDQEVETIEMSTDIYSVIEGMKSGYMLRRGWALKPWCRVKEARHRSRRILLK